PWRGGELRRTGGGASGARTRACRAAGRSDNGLSACCGTRRGGRRCRRCTPGLHRRGVGVKVLLADDDLVSRRLLEAMLVRLGYDVVVASDGLEARQILLAPDGPRL